MKINQTQDHNSVIVEEEILSPEFLKQSSKADPMNLWGLWNGEETIEELLEELD